MISARAFQNVPKALLCNYEFRILGVVLVTAIFCGQMVAQTPAVPTPWPGAPIVVDSNSHSSQSASAVFVDTFCLGGVGSTPGTYVLVPATSVTNANCNGSITAIEMPMAYKCTAKNFFVTAGVSSGDTVALYVNGSTSSSYPHCSLSTGTSPYTCSDTSDSITINAGTPWSARATETASDATANIRVAFQCQ